MNWCAPSSTGIHASAMNSRRWRISRQRDMADPARHMTLQPQPDERLDELVGTEQHGDPRQRDELAALADMADGIDADRAYQQTAAQGGLGREEHAGLRHGPRARPRMLARLPVAGHPLPGPARGRSGDCFRAVD